MSTTDEKDIAKIDRVKGDEKPITREYAMLPWAAGRPYVVDLDRTEGFIRDTRPDLIGFDTLDRMRRHAPIKAALTLIKMPVLSRLRQAQAECEDKDIEAMVQQELIDSGLLYKLGVSSMRAVELGVAFHEKRWTAKEIHVEYDTTDETTGEKTTQTAWDGIAHTYKEIREVNPASVTEILRRTEQRGYAGAQADESFDGFRQGTTGDGQPRDVDAWRSFVYTYGKEFGNMWGEPRDRDAYPYYTWATFILKCWMAWVERKVVPPNKSFFPMGKSKMPNGMEVDNQTIALMIGKAINNSSTIALPSTNIAKDARGGSGRRIFRDWDLEELPRTDVTEIFSKTKAELDADMFRAMFTPPRTFDSSNGDGGLFSTDAEAHFDVFLSTEDGIILEFGGTAEDYMVEPFVNVNFGVDSPKCRIKIPGLSDEQRQMLEATFNALIANPDIQARVDFDALAKGFSVPLKDVTNEEDGANGNAIEDPSAVQGSVPGGNTATGTAEPGTPSAGTAPALPNGNTGAGALATPSGTASTAPGARPNNLILDDSDALPLALADMEFAIELASGGFDATHWAVEPDGSSILGYRVTDLTTGKRVGGYVALKVIQSFQAQAKGAASKGASAAKAAQNKAAAAAKKAQNEAKAAQNKADAAAKKAQTQQTQAAKRAEATAKRDAAAANRKAVQAQKAADHEVLKEQHAQAAEAKKTAAATAHAQRISQAAAAHATHSVINGTITTTPAQAKTEVGNLQKQTATQTPQQAGSTLNAAGWTATGQYNNREAAIAAASGEAQGDPTSHFAVVAVAGGFVVASKPQTAAPAAAPAKPAKPTKAPKPVKAEDPNTGTEETAKLITRAARKIGRIFDRG